MTTVCFHISAVLYVLFGILAFAMFAFLMPSIEPDFPSDVGWIFGILMLLLCILLAIGIEVVTWGLRNLQYWAWVTGIVISAIYIPSIFLVFGILGLIGLLNSDTQAAFQAARLRRQENE